MGDQQSDRPDDGAPADGSGSPADGGASDRGQAADRPAATRWPGNPPDDADGRAAAPWQSPGPSGTPYGAPSGTPYGAPYGGPGPARPAAPSSPPNPWEQPVAGYPPYPGHQGGPYGAQPRNQGWSGHAAPGTWQGGSSGGQAYPPPPYQAPPKPGVIPLRPLGLGEILDGAFQACRRNPVATFGSAILLQAVVTLVTVLLLGNVLSSFEVFESGNPTSEGIIGAFAGLGVFASIAGVVSGVALLVLQGILVIPVARAVIDQRTSFGQAWRLARSRILPLLGFGVLSFAVGLVGMMLLIGISVLAIAGLEEYSALVIVPLVLGVMVALVWAGTKLVVAPAALMLEGTGPWRSIKRSWALTRGNWWRTFGIVLLTSVIVSIIASVISMPLTFAVSLLFGFGSPASATPSALESLPLLAATQAVTALFTAVGYAFQAGVTSLLYVDLRMRREGFDVVLLREHEQAGTGRTDVLPGGTASFGHQPGGPA